MLVILSARYLKKQAAGTYRLIGNNSSAIIIELFPSVNGPSMGLCSYSTFWLSLKSVSFSAPQ